MLDEVGYMGMTMRDLAKRAGVAQGTLYNLYGSKDDLILAAVVDLLGELGREVGHVAPEPGIDAVLALTDAMGRSMQQTPNYTDAIARSLFNAQPGDPMVELLLVRSIPFVEQHLAIAIKQGQLVSDSDPKLVARHYVGQGWGVLLYWMKGLLPVTEIRREYLRASLMMLSGICTEPSRGHLAQKLAEL